MKYGLPRHRPQTQCRPNRETEAKGVANRNSGIADVVARPHCDRFESGLDIVVGGSPEDLQAATLIASTPITVTGPRPWFAVYDDGTPRYQAALQSHLSELLARNVIPLMRFSRGPG